MNWNDYVLTLTTSVLKTKQSELNEKLEYIGKIIRTDVLRAPKTISVGAQSDSGEDFTFNEWIRFLFSENIKKIDLINFNDADRELPAHIMAAFAGGHEYLLRVTTDKCTRAYTLKMYTGPAYTISFSQLAELIDAQELKNDIWKRVVEIVNNSNGMNNLPVIEPDKMHEYFDDKKNGPPEYLLTDITSEIQVECKALNSEFRLPEHLKTHFYKSENNDFFGPDDSERIFLMTRKPFSVAEILMLINAQSFPEEIWNKYEEDKKIYEENISQHIIDKQYEKFVNSLSEDELHTLNYTITDAICRICEKHRLSPVIPEELKNHFESELEHNRAKARGSWDKWYLKSNEDTWNMYYFDLLNIDKAILVGRLPDNGKSAFINTLTTIAAFAKKIESPYSEAFRLSLFFMTTKFPEVNSEKERNNAIITLMQKQGFQERAVGVFNDKSYYLEEFHKMGIPESDAYSLIAIDIANVFGGMGSWNDESLTEPNDYETHQKISGELYKIMKNYFVNILSA